MRALLVANTFATTTDDAIQTQVVNELSKRLASGFTKRDAIDEVTAALGLPRKRVYTLATQK